MEEKKQTDEQNMTKLSQLEEEKKQYKRNIDEMARQNAALQTKLAELVSITRPLVFKLWITGAYNLDCYGLYVRQ